MSGTLLHCDAPEQFDNHQESARVKTVRVLHVVNGEHYAGAERVQDLLAQRLGAFGFKVGFACLKPREFPWMRQSKQAPLYVLPMANRFDLRAVWTLVRIVRRQGYGLIHAHTVRSAMVAAMASVLTGVPMVQHVHSPTSRDTTHRWRNRLNALIERACLRRASALIAVSESLGRHVRRLGISGHRVFVVPNGVPAQQPRNCPDFRVSESGTGPFAARDAAKSTWTLGTVALMRPRKGIEVLLQAVAMLAGQGLPVRLRAVGGFETPEYEGQVKGTAAELGVAGLVDWTGFTQDVDRELAQMDLLVLPSLFGEGLPMVILEAMAAGVPVVASSVEGVPEAIRHGRDGLLVRPGDPADLAGAIDRVVRGEVDWHALRSSAMERHRLEFSDLKMAARVAEVYRRVLGSEMRG